MGRATCNNVVKQQLELRCSEVSTQWEKECATLHASVENLASTVQEVFQTCGSSFPSGQERQRMVEELQELRCAFQKEQAQKSQDVERLAARMATCSLECGEMHGVLERESRAQLDALQQVKERVDNSEKECSVLRDHLGALGCKPQQIPNALPHLSSVPERSRETEEQLQSRRALCEEQAQHGQE